MEVTNAELTSEKDRELIEVVAMPWICVEETPCEETVAVHWEELLTALTARLAIVRIEERKQAFKDAVDLIGGIKNPGDRDGQFDSEDKISEAFDRALTTAIDTLEAACCPEDVGFDEYIRALQSQLEQVTKERDDANERAATAQKSVEDLSRAIFDGEQATSMRSACVEKVREVLKPYELEFRRKTNSATNIVDYVAMALESVSIQEQKQ